MPNQFSRTEMLIGKEALHKLSLSKVAVFGIGGVGSFAVEGLARSGIGKLVLIDNDVICATNINRQIHASHKTLGRSKVEVMRERVLEINPLAEVEIHQVFYMPEHDDLINDDFDYLIDAIDTVTAKLDLIVKAKEKGIPVISCMGSGNKLDPSQLEISDIYETSVCPLARVMRRELRQKGIKDLKVIYSKEPPLSPLASEESTLDNRSSSRRQIPGSVAFVPSVAGMLIAGEVVKDLIKIK